MNWLKENHQSCLNYMLLACIAIIMVTNHYQYKTIEQLREMNNLLNSRVRAIEVVLFTTSKSHI